MNDLFLGDPSARIKRWLEGGETPITGQWVDAFGTVMSPSGNKWIYSYHHIPEEGEPYDIVTTITYDGTHWIWKEVDPVDQEYSFEYVSRETSRDVKTLTFDREDYSDVVYADWTSGVMSHAYLINNETGNMLHNARAYEGDDYDLLQLYMESQRYDDTVFPNSMYNYDNEWYVTSTYCGTQIYHFEITEENETQFVLSYVGADDQSTGTLTLEKHNWDKLTQIPHGDCI